MFNFGRTTFAMLIPVQSDEMLEAMGQALIKLGAKQVSYASETLVDKEGKPVYDCLAAIVENMPKISAAAFLTKHQHDVHGLRGRIKGFKPGRTFLEEVSQEHQELSIIPVRKSVMSIPAVLTILGTREALVIPGMLLTSRK